jgi:hypothetical protein
LRLYRVTGWFHSEINNWHGLSQSKNAKMERAGRGFLRLLYCLEKKGCIFSAMRCCGKCAEKSSAGRKSRKGLIAEN